MTLAAALLFLLVPQGQVPGLITVPAGKTAFGADLKTQKKLIEAHPSAANELGAEVPRSTVELPAFAIAPTETTNEMYLRFVKATGYQPR